MLLLVALELGNKTGECIWGTLLSCWPTPSQLHHCKVGRNPTILHRLLLAPMTCEAAMLLVAGEICVLKECRWQLAQPTDCQLRCKAERLPAHSCTGCLAGCWAQQITCADSLLLMVQLCKA